MKARLLTVVEDCEAIIAKAGGEGQGSLPLSQALATTGRKRRTSGVKASPPLPNGFIAAFVVSKSYEIERGRYNPKGSSPHYTDSTLPHFRPYLLSFLSRK